jgi:hypothetical protein
MIMQQNQWFFFDEWAFLQLVGPDIWTSHVGHWSTAPTLIYDGLRAVFGLSTYLPYALIVTVLHLAAAHLVWRISLRSGANRWIATSLVLVFIFLGTGAENILWAFQIGFVGAVVFGLLAFLLALSPSGSPWRFTAIVALSLFSLTWSGTSLPLVAATAAVLLWRRGWRWALLFAAVNAAVYLTWYALNALGTGPDTGGFGLYKLLVAVPEFIGVMLIIGFGAVFPVPGLGFLLLLALAVWLFLTLRRRTALPAALPALILMCAAAIFVLLTAYSRAALSVGSGRSSRYVYLLVLLLIPLFGVALTRVIQERKRALVIVCVVLVALAGYQSSVLGQQAFSQAQTEQGSKRLLNAALHLYVVGTPGLRLDAIPDPQWAPDLSMQDLVDLYRIGYFPLSDYTAEDLKHAEANVVGATK